MPEEENQEEQQSTGAAAVGGGDADRNKSNQLESGYYSVVSQTTSTGQIIIGQDIEIFPDKECKEFARHGARAYEAKDRRLPGEQIALLCGSSGVPRVTMIGSYRNIRNPHLLRLVDAGIVNWPADHRQWFAMIFEKPTGKKVLETPDAKPRRVADDRLLPAVIQPAVAVLTQLQNIDMIHGAINLENIYLTGAMGLETIVLGECLSSAPSSWQHALYETIPRAMADPVGRGAGTIQDDLYALGVCVAMMLRGENMLAGKTAQQIIHEKIEHGSYGMLLKGGRVPPDIAEFLRAVLNDDENQRWDIDDVQRWLDGRRQSPKQSRVVLKAARAFVFCDQKYWDLRPIAQALSENIPEAATEIEKNDFELWLKRNFEDQALNMRVDSILEKEKSSSREKLVASICMALDPEAPIRYKGRSIFPAGLGTALAEAMFGGQEIQTYGEMLSLQLFSNWISQSFDDLPDGAELMSLFEKCRNAIAQKMPGYGMERILYTLCPEAACLSPVLKDYFVLGPGSLLLALEALSRQAEGAGSILDRHMIAFISVREPKMIDPYLGYVNSPDRGHQMVGVIRTLAAIQRRFATGPVPGICGWLISQTAPMIDLLQDRDLRQEISKRVGSLSGSGNLTALLELVDNPALTKDDRLRYLAACREYQTLVVEKSKIGGFFKNQKNFGRATGRQIAMVLSSALSVVVIICYVVLRMTKNL